MKKIWLFCLCLACLGLAWCFHIPDEDWLPSKNKVNTWSTQKDNEMDQALKDIMEWINMIPSEWDERKKAKNDEINNEESETLGTGGENIDIEETIENKEDLNNEEIINTGNENLEIEENVVE